MGFTGFYWVLIVFYSVLLVVTGFYCILLDSNGFHWLLMGFTRL